MKRLALICSVAFVGTLWAAGEYFDIQGTSRILMGQDNQAGNAVPVPLVLAQALAKGQLSAEQHELLIGIAATNGCVERAIKENMPDPKKHSYRQKEAIVRCGIQKVFHCALQLLVVTRLSELSKGDAQSRQSSQEELLLLLTQLAKQDECKQGQNVPASVVNVVKSAGSQ